MAREVIQVSSYAAAAATVVPLPMAELALLLPIHTSMVMTVGHVSGRPVSRTEAARVAVELGAIAGLTMAGTAALTVLRKLLLPGIGGVLAAPASFALTFALGKVAIEYFENPEWSRERLRVVFDEAMAEGRKLFSKERFEEFRRKYGEGRDVADEARDAAAPAADISDPPASSGARPGSADRPIDVEALDESEGSTADPRGGSRDAEPSSSGAARRPKRNL